MDPIRGFDAYKLPGEGQFRGSKLAPKLAHFRCFGYKFAGPAGPFSVIRGSKILVNFRGSSVRLPQILVDLVRLVTLVTVRFPPSPILAVEFVNASKLIATVIR